MATAGARALTPIKDDLPTVIAISLVAGMVADVLHEGVGHAAVALATVGGSGVLSTVAWSSAQDSRLIAAGGTLVNLAAGVLFWTALRAGERAAIEWRVFFYASMAFNLFTGTGYFFFSGVTNFGDWAEVIAGLPAHWLWRTLLVVVGVASYYGAVLAVGSALVCDVGAAVGSARYRRFTLVPYSSAVALAIAGGLMNPLGMPLIWQSALPASAGADSGLLWMKYYLPKRRSPQGPAQTVSRSYAWMAVAGGLALLFIFVMGRGIALHR